MARGRKSSGGGCGTGLILICIVALIAQYWVAIAVVLVAFFVVWLIVQGIRSYNNNHPKIVTESTKKNSSTADSSSLGVASEFINGEIDRQIREFINKRNRLNDELYEIELQIKSNNRPWNRNKEHLINETKKLEKTKQSLESRINGERYIISETTTDSFINLMNAFSKIRGGRLEEKNGAPNFNSIFTEINPNVYDIFKFTVKPIAIAIKGRVFYITPHYVMEFNSHGKYINSYYPSVIDGKLVNGSYTKQIPHQTWLHTRVDGQPDRRYSYNPPRTYYTTEHYTIYDMLSITIVGNELKYESSFASYDKTDLMNKIHTYSRTVAPVVYDPVYHITRLLKLCTNNMAIDEVLKNVNEA